MTVVKTVFVSGSMGVLVLPVEAKTALDKIMSLGMRVCVGDAPGVDTKVQVYLAAAGYKLVSVYGCSLYGLRFGHPDGKKLGWMKRIVKGGPVDKDIAMSGASFGLAIWDGSSKGTKGNISRLESKGVKCKVVSAKAHESK